ncbi:unnamed protein product [Alternaria sp. RS040]
MFSSGVKYGKRHATLESFTKAAAEGCCICAPFLRDAMKEASALGQDCFNPEEGYSYISTSSVKPASADFKLLAVDMEMEKSEEILYWYRRFIAVPQAVLPVGMSVSAQATRPDQSCLGGYNLDCTPPFEADIVDGADVAGSRTYTILSKDYFQEALYDQPISSRAWVMQERLLATRVLSIGHGELFWDCQQVQNASESLPYGFTRCSDLHKDYITKEITTLSVPSILRISSSEDLENIWSEIIEEYTARELTYPAVDKLAAISAIATRMGDAMNDTYVSGHFLKTLPGSLGWNAA